MKMRDVIEKKKKKKWSRVEMELNMPVEMKGEAAVVRRGAFCQRRSEIAVPAWARTHARRPPSLPSPGRVAKNKTRWTQWMKAVVVAPWRAIARQPFSAEKTTYQKRNDVIN